MPAPVLLLHGLAGSAATTWGEAGWLDLLADAGRTVIAPDLPGHAGTPLPDDHDLAGWVLATLDDAGVDGPVDAIGFSLGARTLLVAAALAPERFGDLVVAGVGANLFRGDDSRRAADAIEAGDDSDPVARYFLAQGAGAGTPPSTIAALMRRPGPACTPEVVAAVTSPTLVVLGDKDFAGPPDPLVDALPDARLVTLRGVDHFSTPKAFGFLDAALDFLGATP